LKGISIVFALAWAVWSPAPALAVDIRVAGTISAVTISADTRHMKIFNNSITQLLPRGWLVTLSREPTGSQLDRIPCMERFTIRRVRLFSRLFCEPDVERFGVLFD